MLCMWGDARTKRSFVDAVCVVHQLVYMSPRSMPTDERWRDMLLNPVYAEYLVALIVDKADCVKKCNRAYVLLTVNFLFAYLPTLYIYFKW